MAGGYSPRSPSGRKGDPLCPGLGVHGSKQVGNGHSDKRIQANIQKWLAPIVKMSDCNQSPFLQGKRIDFGSRNKGTASEKCSVNSERFFPWLLGNDFSSCKKSMYRGMEASVQPQNVEQFPRNTSLQDGDPFFHNKCNGSRGLCSISGSEGCLFTHPDSSRIQKVSQIPLQGHQLPVERSSLRPFDLASSFHQSDGRTRRLGQVEGNQSVSIPRRLVIEAQKSTDSCASFNHTSETVSKIGTNTKSSQIGGGTVPEIFIPINLLRHGKRAYFSESEVVPRIKNFNSRTNQQEAGPSNFLAKNSGKTGVGCKTGSFGPITLPKDPDSTKSLLETEFRSPPRLSPYWTDKPGSALVDPGRQCLPGGPPLEGGASVDSDHRCFSRRLGGAHPGFGSLRRMEQSISPHKYSGIVVNKTQFNSISERCGPQDHKTVNRQYFGPCLSQSSRRNSFRGTEQLGDRDPFILQGSQNLSGNSPYSGETEYKGRSVVKKAKTSTIRMVSEQKCSEPSVLPVGNTSGGPICNTGKQGGPNFCISVPRRESAGSRRSVNKMAKRSSLCLPSTSTSSFNIKEISKGGRGNDSNSNCVPKKKLVPGRVVPGSRPSTKVTSLGGPGVSRITKGSPQESSKPRPTRLEVISSSIRDLGVSGAAVDRVSKPQRQSTIIQYESRWKLFVAWCKGRKVDFLNPTIPLILDFLSYLKDNRNLTPQTIQTYRAMLVSTFKFSHPFLVENSLLRDFMRRIWLENPLKRKFFPDWDLKRVLESLKRFPYEPIEKAQLKFITGKLAFLLALASARRRSELHAIQCDDKHIVFTKEKGNTVVYLWTSPGFLAKNQKPSSLPTPMKIPSLEEFSGGDKQEMLLCPVRALKAYLKATKNNPLRKSKEPSRLFLPIKEGKKEISPTTMSSYIVLPINLTYNRFAKDLDIHAHQLRGVAASLAHLRGVSLDMILKAAFWKTPTVFILFYLQDLAAVSEGLNRLGPLVAAQQTLIQKSK